MKTPIFLRTIFISLALLTSMAAHGAEERGTFGFAVTVDVEGMFDHTLKSAVIKTVEPGLPAAAAGISPGDNVLEVEGRRVQAARRLTSLP